MLKYLKQLVLKIPYLGHKYAIYRARKSVDWRRLRWARGNATSTSNPNKRVLMATSLGDYEMGVLLESTLAVSLGLRGARVDVLLCDKALEACQMSKIESISPPLMASKGPASRCDACVSFGTGVFDGSGATLLFYSNYLDVSAREAARRLALETPFSEIRGFVYEGVSVGEHAYAGCLRYFARGDLNGEEWGERILRRYLESSMLTVFAVSRLLEENEYDVACFHHGIYVPQGLITQVCQRKRVRVVTWNPAYRKNTFVFSHGDTYHHTMISEPTQSWEQMPWDDVHRQAIQRYLDSRRRGTEDWIWFHDTPEEQQDKIEMETGIDFSKPCIGLFTNVMWDAQLHYRSNAFSSMLEWVTESIRYFAGRPELECIIRIHPAEIRGAIPSRQPLLEEIVKAFPELPPNVKVIPPESQISTYAIMDRCNAVLIYNTKTGIEVSSQGIPVVVAGEAWIRGKGIALDADDPTSYVEILDRLPFAEPMTDEQQDRALRYAYHFFFRRMIPLPFIHHVPGTSRYSARLADVARLSPGSEPGLDVICDGILQGTPFNFGTS